MTDKVDYADPVAFVKEAERRFHTDAEFHAKVERAALLLETAVNREVADLGISFPFADQRMCRLGAIVALQLSDTSVCEFCGNTAPADQYHPEWHDDGSPMVACDACIGTDNARGLAQKHQEHYRSCNCLGDSAECCVASCECHDPSHSDSTVALDGDTGPGKLGT